MSRLLAQILVEEAPAWGVKLQRRGDKLTVSPASKCPPDFKALLRENKPEILSLLEAKDDGLAPDCAPWLHVARQVLAGEFDGCDSSVRESIFIGLRSIDHVLCRHAVEKLNLLEK